MTDRSRRTKTGPEFRITTGGAASMTARYLLTILLCIAFVHGMRAACFSSLNSALAAIEEHGLKAALLRSEYRTDPLGIDTTQPRLSWIVTSTGRGQKQTAYQ